MEPQLVLRLLLQVLARELLDIMVIKTEEGGLKKERYAENNIIISDSNLRNILPPQLNKTTYRYKVMCDCECCTSPKSMNYYLLTWRNYRLKQLKYRSRNAQNRRYSEISSRIFETYKNAVQPHGYHIYNTAADMAMSTKLNCTYKHHGIPHCKYVLHCCDKCPSIFLPSQEANKDTTNTCPTITFHVYLNISRCTLNGRRP